MSDKKLQIIIRGPARSGKTTLAHLLKFALSHSGVEAKLDDGSDIASAALITNSSSILKDVDIVIKTESLRYIRPSAPQRRD